LRFDSNAAIARILVRLKMQGYEVDYPARRNAYFEAVTVEDVQRAARRLFDPEALSFVLVGQPAGVEPR
jgi:zinc protease